MKLLLIILASATLGCSHNSAWVNGKADAISNAMTRKIARSTGSLREFHGEGYIYPVKEGVILSPPTYFLEAPKTSRLFPKGGKKRIDGLYLTHAELESLNYRPFVKGSDGKVMKFWVSDGGELLRTKD